MDAIRGFFGEYRFLSNFYPSVIIYEGITYPTVEHAYQAAKVEGLTHKLRMAKMATPGDAKRLGQNVDLVTDWNDKKLGIMYDLNKLKYTTHQELRGKLILTGDRDLEETNSWGDTYWGVYKNVGHNKLGLILMRIRKELRDHHASAI